MGACTKIKIGVLNSQPEPVKGFDLTSFYVKSCTGKTCKPADNIYNIVSCFGDNKTARKNPEWLALSKSGKAARTNRSKRFLWDHICPSVKEYKTILLDQIAKTLKADVKGIHLDCIGFPETEYCTCTRCVEEQKESKLERIEWRSQIVTDFVREASKLAKEKGKSFSVTLLPDPYFGKERYGEDFRALAKFVDFFLVPIYDLEYSTTYWLETLAYAFCKQLDKLLYIELYAANPGPKLKNLISAMVAVSSYADGIILATHDTILAEKIQNKLVNDFDFEHLLKRKSYDSLTDIVRKRKEQT